MNEAQKQALAGKLSPKHVKTRQQAGRTLSYIEGWHAIAEANRIFGFDGWTRETIDTRQVGSVEKNQKGNMVVGYAAKVRVVACDIIREGSGFGSGIAKSEIDAHESAIKEAETDAMKRALMTFGNPFGLALYDKDQGNVGDEITEDDKTLAHTLVTAIQCATSAEDLTAWVKDPDHKRALDGLPDGLKANVRGAYSKHMKQLEG